MPRRAGVQDVGPQLDVHEIRQSIYGQRLFLDEGLAQVPRRHQLPVQEWIHALAPRQGLRAAHEQGSPPDWVVKNAYDIVLCV